MNIQESRKPKASILLCCEAKYGQRNCHFNYRPLLLLLLSIIIIIITTICSYRYKSTLHGFYSFLHLFIVIIILMYLYYYHL